MKKFYHDYHYYRLFWADHDEDGNYVTPKPSFSSPFIYFDVMRTSHRHNFVIEKMSHYDSGFYDQ